MEKRILVLGSSGMLGHVVYNFLLETKKYSIFDSSFPTKANDNSKLLDVTNKDEVSDFILAEKPDVVINCIGVLIKGSLEDPSNAIYINSFFPHQLSKLLIKTGGKLIHISTDCVFSGIKGTYSETDFRDSDEIYGRSKALGEVINDCDLTLRTSLIGPEIKKNGEGLFSWFMRQSGEIYGYSNVFWGGVTTLELANAIDQCIENEVTGLLHITNGTKISKEQLLQLFRKIWQRNDIEIFPIISKETDKSLITMRNDFTYQVPSYNQMLGKLKFWMDTHNELYRTIY